LIVCLMLMPCISFSQSLDSLPVKELNSEFLKGLQARERVVLLKELREWDQKLISHYRDSLIPVKEKKIVLLTADNQRLTENNQKLAKVNKRITWLSLFLAVGLAYKW
jgi:hypothetical protein